MYIAPQTGMHILRLYLVRMYLPKGSNWWHDQLECSTPLPPGDGIRATQRVYVFTTNETWVIFISHEHVQSGPFGRAKMETLQFHAGESFHVCRHITSREDLKVEWHIWTPDGHPIKYIIAPEGSPHDGLSARIWASAHPHIDPWRTSKLHRKCMHT